MAFTLADRVGVNSTTTGTGTYTLGSVLDGFQSFAVIGNGNSTVYVATDGVDWEVGNGTYSSTGPALTRDTILASSNSGSAVNWSAGTKSIYCTVNAANLLTLINYAALLSGRAGGQILTGGTASGEVLELKSTSHATKGGVQLAAGEWLRIPEVSAPGTPASGFGAIYEKTDGHLYFKDDSGLERRLTAGCNVQSFSSSGTWTKPAGASALTPVLYFLRGSGGGGGSGRRAATGTNRYGGGGGGPGGFVFGITVAGLLSATEAVTVGTGGLGGAAQTANDTNGNAGQAGGSTSFASHSALGGLAGAGGTSAGPAAGSTQASAIGGPFFFTGATGASGGGNSATSQPAAVTQWCPTAGGGGAAIGAGEVVGTTGTGATLTFAGRTFSGGSAGTSGGNGGDGVDAGMVGTGGGGGSASLAAAGGNGGNGVKGAGGGGGGGAANGYSSGAGGNGGDGAAWIITLDV